MPELSFLKKLSLPSFSFKSLSRKSNSVVGIDIGVSSAKVVQLRYDQEKAVLETYGELISEGYLKTGSGTGGGFLRYTDNDIADLLRSVLRESETTSKEAVLSIPATSSFITKITFTRLTPKEIEQAITFEARKYIPIPISEVTLDWEIFSPENENEIDVLLVAVPREIIEKLKRISGLAGVNLRSLEVETFSLVRSLVGHDQTPTAIVNMGHQSTTLALVDKRQLRVAYNIAHGSQKLTVALERGLGITRERAEQTKKEVGLSDRMEEKEISSVIYPFIENLFTEVERYLSLYNRRAGRKIQKINLTGGGSNLKGIVEYSASKFGIEVTRGNSFNRITAPAFMQPVLREIGPSFSIAVGLALREMTSR